MSLRRRVLLGFAAVAMVLLVADVALAGTFRGYLVGRIDDRLRTTADQFVAIAAAPGRPELLRPGRRGDDHFPRGFPGPGTGPVSEFYIGVADAEGQVLGRLSVPLRAEQAPPAPPPELVTGSATAPGAPLRPFTAPGDGPADWRMVAVQIRGGDLGDGEIALIGTPLAEIGPTYRRMVAVLALATGAVLATLAVVAWWVLRQGVRPLVAMTATAEAIAAGRLDERVAETDERTEAGRLGSALNAMLERIQAAFASRARSEARLRQFVADASHELRTPLTSIRGYAELYRAGGLAPGGELDGAMRRVESEAGRMGELVEDLLTLARLDEGRPMEHRRVDLGAVAADAARDLRAVQPNRRVITDLDHTVTVVGDEARLRQAVTNLVANVRSHTPEAATVRVAVRHDADDAVVEVADEGPGMPPDVADRIFERFYRADPARTRATGGSGLGLSIVAGIVAAHGGRVDVESAPGAGSTFRLRLPVDGALPAASREPAHGR